MKLVVYADESGTHDPSGNAPGSAVANVAGMLAPHDEWTTFSKHWQAALTKYQAPYFHFCEWSDAACVARGKRKVSSGFIKRNPYQGWSHERLDAFLLELAEIAGSGNKSVVGISANISKFRAEQAAAQRPADASPYEECVNRFFENVVETISTQRAPWKRVPTEFVFDQSDDPKWVDAVTGLHREMSVVHRQFRSITFADKTDPRYLPLQAADMVAYRARQTSENWLNDNFNMWEEFDMALFRSVHKHVDLNEPSFMRRHLMGEFDPR